MKVGFYLAAVMLVIGGIVFSFADEKKVKEQ